MSEGKNHSKLEHHAPNGDSMENGLDNHGVETDGDQSSASESMEKYRKGKSVRRGPSYRKFKFRDAHDGIRKGREVMTLEEFCSNGKNSSWEDVERVVTAKALCDEKDPIDKAFEVHQILCQNAKISTENTNAIEKLADKVEKFAYDLLDQVKRNEEKDIQDETADRYVSLFSEITTKAIAKGQKKFLSHPFIFKRVEKRWKFDLSEDFQSRLPHRLLLLLIMMLDVVLTPVLFPFNAYVAYKDQQGDLCKEIESKVTKIQVIYRDYIETPYVIFMKTQFMQLIFIGLFFRISMTGSSVAPTSEEGLILLFFCGFVLSEIQQYRSSERKIYFRDMWNYMDVLIMLIYAFVFTCRTASIIIGGDAPNNRLLELAHYGYGFDAMLLILRFSSILELSSVIGPLQLALFRMCLDLLVILVQFSFVIVAFSLAITKCYSAETSFLTPLKNGSNNLEYCVEGSLNCFFKSARQLVWSVFGMTHFEEMESTTSLTSDVVVFLYLVFLILSVIMLVNILVALLTTTYDSYNANAEIEWKFSRAVVEEEYRRMHVIVVPFNIISEPFKALYFAICPDFRDKGKKERKQQYKKFFQETFFPEITERYKREHKESFPLTVDRKLDTLGKSLESVKKDLDEMNGLWLNKQEQREECQRDVERKLARLLEELQKMQKRDHVLKETENHITGTFQRQNFIKDNCQETQL